MLVLMVTVSGYCQDFTFSGIISVDKMKVRREIAAIKSSSARFNDGKVQKQQRNPCQY